MYRDNSQLRIEDFIFPYGELDPENDWVKLAAQVPWDTVEERYAAQFVNNGAPAHPCRVALGALLIQRRLKCSDKWLVKHIGENPYLQLHRNKRVWSISLWGIHTGRFSKAVQRGGYGGDSGGVHSPAGEGRNP